MSWWDTLVDTIKHYFSDAWHSMDISGDKYFETNYDVGFDGKPVSGTGNNGIDTTIQTNTGIGGANATPPYNPDANGVDPGFPGHDFNIDEVISESTFANDASVYGRVKGSNVEEQLLWLIENDPDNAQGWMEQLLGVRGERENVQSARDYSEFVSKNSPQWVAEGLEKAGINPLLAYQYLSGTSGSVGTAGYPDSRVSTNATSRENASTVLGGKYGAAIIAMLAAVIGVYLKKTL